MTRHDAAVWGALGLAACSGLAGLFGLARWYLAQPSRAFWVAARTAQALAVAYAALAGIVFLTGGRPATSLYWLYALLPIAIGFVAEQLRLVAADHVLVTREIDDTQQLARLPRDEQEAIVLAILRREMVIMALAAVVVCFLALRAAGTY